MKWLCYIFFYTQLAFVFHLHRDFILLTTMLLLVFIFFREILIPSITLIFKLFFVSFYNIYPFVITISLKNKVKNGLRLPIVLLLSIFYIAYITKKIMNHWKIPANHLKSLNKGDHRELKKLSTYFSCNSNWSENFSIEIDVIEVKKYIFLKFRWKVCKINMKNKYNVAMDLRH